MRAEVRLGITSGDSVEELASLWEWLADDPGLSGQVRRVSTPGAPTDLSGGLELLTVAVGSGGVLAVLAQSASTWLQTRRGSVKLTVSSGDRTASIEADHVNDRQVSEIVAVLREVLADTADHADEASH